MLYKVVHPDSDNLVSAPGCQLTREWSVIVLISQHTVRYVFILLLPLFLSSSLFRSLSRSTRTLSSCRGFMRSLVNHLCSRLCLDICVHNIFIYLCIQTYRDNTETVSLLPKRSYCARFLSTTLNETSYWSQDFLFRAVTYLFYPCTLSLGRKTSSDLTYLYLHILNFYIDYLSKLRVSSSKSTNSVSLFLLLHRTRLVCSAIKFVNFFIRFLFVFVVLDQHLNVTRTLIPSQKAKHFMYLFTLIFSQVQCSLSFSTWDLSKNFVVFRYSKPSASLPPGPFILSERKISAKTNHPYSRAA